MRTGIIYLAVNTVNGKAYVGQTLRLLKERRSHHQHCARAGSDFQFHTAMRKYGEASFGWRVLASDIPEAQLDTYECFWIRFYGTFRDGYNATTGGDGGGKSEETKAKMRETAKSRLEAGIHDWGGDAHRVRMRAENERRLSEGTHNFLQPDFYRERWRNQQRAARQALKASGQQFLFEDDNA